MKTSSALKLITLLLQAKLDRLPTEDELFDFIFGDSETRKKIWNGGYDGSS